MDLEKVLDELTEEKRWLETLIGALEIAAQSPVPGLIRTLDENLWMSRSSSRSWALHRRRRQELARMVSLLQRTTIRPQEGRSPSAGPPGAKVLVFPPASGDLANGPIATSSVP